jgi:uncharacterized alpha-E superfamily protein
MNNHMARLATLYGRDTEAQTATTALLAELQHQSTDQIFEEGLHEFLSRYIRQVANLGVVIHNSYLSGDMH